MPGEGRRSPVCSWRQVAVLGRIEPVREPLNACSRQYRIRRWNTTTK